jgi:hypothetical protein
MNLHCQDEDAQETDQGDVAAHLSTTPPKTARGVEQIARCWQQF